MSVCLSVSVCLRVSVCVCALFATVYKHQVHAALADDRISGGCCSKLPVRGPHLAGSPLQSRGERSERRRCVRIDLRSFREADRCTRTTCATLKGFLQIREPGPPEVHNSEHVVSGVVDSTNHTHST